ncbi:unnamed protein product, partial [Staurois parvus]
AQDGASSFPHPQSDLVSASLPPRERNLLAAWWQDRMGTWRMQAASLKIGTKYGAVSPKQQVGDYPIQEEEVLVQSQQGGNLRPVEDPYICPQLSLADFIHEQVILSFDYPLPLKHLDFFLLH